MRQLSLASINVASLLLIAASLLACGARTRVGVQAADQSGARGGSKAADSDRELPGYLVEAENGVDFVYFARRTGINAMVFPVVLESYVLGADVSLSAVTVLSDPILLAPAIDGAELTELQSERALVEVCTRVTQDHAEMGVIFPNEGIYLRALNAAGDRVCFARVARFVLNQPYAFVRTTDGAIPRGFSLVQPAANPLLPVVNWAANDDAGTVAFQVASNQDEYQHALGIQRHMAPATCAGGESFLSPVGDESIEFNDLDSSIMRRGRVCAIDPQQGFVSPGVEIALDNGGGDAGAGDGSDNGGGTGIPMSAQLMFVTSQTFLGNMGADAGVDRLCQVSAEAAELSGTWKAVISTVSGHARTRVGIHGAVYNMVGEKLADSASDFWDGELENAVGHDEFGSDRPVMVWTGSRASGEGYATGEHCLSWMSSGELTVGSVGLSYRRTAEWMEFNAMPCDNSASLYCINGQ